MSSENRKVKVVLDASKHPFVNLAAWVTAASAQEYPAQEKREVYEAALKQPNDKMVEYLSAYCE